MRSGAWERAVLALVGAALALAFALVVTPWGAPDEPQHYEYVAALERLGRLPGREDISLDVQGRLIDSMEQHDYWQLGMLPRHVWGYAPTQLDRPPLPYLLYLPAYLAWPHLAALVPVPSAQLEPAAARRSDVNPVGEPAGARQSDGGSAGEPAGARRPDANSAGEPPGARRSDANSARDPASRLLAMRLVSVVLAGLTVLVVATAAAELFPDDPLLRLAPPLLAALTPQVAFIGGSLNSDNLANLVGALTFLALLRAVRPGATPRAWLPVLLLLAVGLATKRTTLFLVPLSLLAVLLYARPLSLGEPLRGPEGRARVRASPDAAPARLVLLSIAAPIALLAAVPILVAKHAQRILDRWIANESLALNLELYTRPDRDWSLATLWGTYTHMARALFESYWARFGWMNVPLHPWLYALLMVLCALPLIGLARLLLRPSCLPLDSWQRRAILLAAAAAPLALVPIAAQYSLLFLPGSLPQGRYLFPALAPIGLLGAVGLAALVPPPRRALAAGALAIGLVALDVVSLAVYAWPAYHSAV